MMDFAASLVGQLAQLYGRMDRAYDKAARRNGFECKGCADNCCETLFFHHTYMEFLYLRSGYDLFEPERRSALLRRARSVASRQQGPGKGGEPLRIMCPLNENGRCVLYAYRPMICRLHGVPHVLRRPDGSRQQGPGCADFDAQCRTSAGAPLDRTPFYIELAGLERQLRSALSLTARIKCTIADMICADEPLGDRIPIPGKQET